MSLNKESKNTNQFFSNFLIIIKKLLKYFIILKINFEFTSSVFKVEVLYI
jgi:hypothetical protein